MEFFVVMTSTEEKNSKVCEGVSLHKYKPYACLWQESRGRYHKEDHDRLRTPFQRDLGRIIHSAAFRRLMHKTQVFVSPENDYLRTRLSHCLEVAQIAKSLARSLEVDEDLAETIALSHDLGHPPFGHVGEEALNEAIQEYGSKEKGVSNIFDHNAHTLKIVTTEKAYPCYDGLNLTWETLEGIVKHNGPIDLSKKYQGSYIETFNQSYDLFLQEYSSLEAQIAAISDDIAYNHHDLDDAVRIGLFAIEDVAKDVACVSLMVDHVKKDYPHLEGYELCKEVVRRLIGRVVSDVYDQTQKNLVRLDIKTNQDVRHASCALVSFSQEIEKEQKELKSYLFSHMYRAPSVVKETEKAAGLIKKMVPFYFENPDKMSEDRVRLFRRRQSDQEKIEIVTDFIAGMTDRFAIAMAEKEGVFRYYG